MQLKTLLSLVALSIAPTLSSANEPKLDFNRDIRPILSENCFQCHGFDEEARQADLRLDLAEFALADRDGVPAIVAGHPENSELWRRITSEDEAEMMPPPDSHRVLKPEQKETLRRWIEEGAVFAKHWSFIPPVKARPPAVTNSSWPRNEIDRFVLARLESNDPPLEPSAAADGYTLVRRLHLDLTGLPPSAEEVEAFVADQSPDAYDKLVDRLLANPHFGERMALDWLDAARYADTNGYSIDGGRHMWLWRDWVIDAFNRNLPYDQFLREQLAGDLLPDRAESQLIATGFQRNNMNTHEGGTIPEENLTNYNVDRVKTLGEAVLGLTLGCAQCHDHKFDPITQRDYYQLFAYFNTLSDIGVDGNAGVNSKPVYEAKTVLQTGEEPKLRREIDQLKEKLANPNPAAVARWEEAERSRLRERGKDFALHPVELLKVSTPNIGKGFDIVAPNFVHVTVPTGMLAYDVSMRLPNTGKPITGVRVVFHPDAAAPDGGRGFGSLADGSPHKNTFVLTSFSASAESVPGDQVNLHKLRDVNGVTASTWLDNYRPENVLDTRNENGWSPDPATKGTEHITVTFAEPVDAADAPFMTVQLNFGHGRNLIGARFEILAMTGTDDGSSLPPDVIAIVDSPSAPAAPAGTQQPATPDAGSAGGSRTVEKQEKLRAYFSAHADETRRDRIALANLEERLAVVTQKHPTMVMDIAEKPRDTFILRRGDYSQPTEKVAAATPAVLPPPPDGAPTNRLGLAQWATMREHPLTARVAVNRIWQMLFGAGLVRTPADFGAQGEYPTHPQLLDWLAVDFMEHGWDTKRLIKQIVLSSTYRQSSHVGEFLGNSQPSVRHGESSIGDTRLRDDPDNRLLARGPRFRLPAEFIRDSALKISGLLVDRLGGPSVNPYTPGDLWREISHYGSTPATAQTFVQDHGEKLYRRSLYTFWKRTVPPPNMVAFDAPNRETCIVARPSTTTPLQALVLLNDVQFVEASRAFAERIIAHSDDDADRLRWAFTETTSRLPADAEFSVLMRALARERERYAGNESATREYLGNGESPRNEKIPSAEHAAWSQVAALLLNLSETISRN
jgi:hypothetical protein